MVRFRFIRKKQGGLKLLLMTVYLLENFHIDTMSGLIIKKCFKILKEGSFFNLQFCEA